MVKKAKNYSSSCTGKDGQHKKPIPVSLPSHTGKDGREKKIPELKCRKCSDDKGLCTGEDQHKPLFVVTLTENFQENMNIACYTRKHFLNKSGYEKDEEARFKITLSKDEGINFSVSVQNIAAATTFSGKQWREYVRIYKKQLGDLMYVFNEKYFARGVPLVHTLTRSNVNRQQLKIPGRVARENLADSGDLTIILHLDKLVVAGSYNVNKADGRVSMNWWRTFMEKNPELVEGDRLQFILSYGGEMAHLFVDLVDDNNEDQRWSLCFLKANM